MLLMRFPDWINVDELPSNASFETSSLFQLTLRLMVIFSFGTGAKGYLLVLCDLASSSHKRKLADASF